jgi:polysaccharide pyruvyl transferase CsaB
MEEITAVLCGYYGQGNGGDEALLASLLQMLPANVKPIVLSGNPKQTRDRYGVEASDRMNAFQVMSALQRSQALILGGGSLLQDATSIRNPVYYTGLLGLARGLGLKTIALAQGIGPLHRPVSRWLAQKALANCTAVSVRDAASAAILSDWKISATIAPDLVWGLAAKPVKGLWDLPAPRVAVALRSHRLLTPDRLNCLTRALADFQAATQTCILLVPFQPDRDLPIAEAIKPHLSAPHHIVCLEDPRELKGLFQGVEMAIGMRYHSLIMAAAQECRCFALSYDPKVSQLMTELDIPGWDLHQLPDRDREISQAWIEHYANGHPLSRDRLHSLKDRTLIHQDLLTAALSTIGARS